MKLPLLVAVSALSAAPLAAQTTAPDYAAGDPVPQHQTFSIDSRALSETRTITIYLPPSYSQDTARRYAVLYMPDGGIREDFPHVANTIDSLISAGAIDPAIVVGIENTERRRDMTGFTAVPADSAIAPRVGGSGAFREFIRDELMPAVERRYRTNGDAAIVGESLAGLFIVETFLLEPELFDRYVALSPSLWWNAGALVQAAGQHLDSAPPGDRLLYLASADEDEIVTATRALASLIESRAPLGLTLVHEPRPDLNHGSIYRRAGPGALARILSW